MRRVALFAADFSFLNSRLTYPQLPSFTAERGAATSTASAPSRIARLTWRTFISVVSLPPHAEIAAATDIAEAVPKKSEHGFTR